jgi:hypothetical protein
VSSKWVSSKWEPLANSEAKHFRVSSELHFKTPQLQANPLFKPTKIFHKAVGMVNYE